MRHLVFLFHKLVKTSPGQLFMVLVSPRRGSCFSQTPFWSQSEFLFYLLIFHFIQPRCYFVPLFVIIKVSHFHVVVLQLVYISFIPWGWFNRTGHLSLFWSSETRYKSPDRPSFPFVCIFSGFSDRPPNWETNFLQAV